MSVTATVSVYQFRNLKAYVRHLNPTTAHSYSGDTASARRVCYLCYNWFDNSHDFTSVAFLMSLNQFSFTNKCVCSTCYTAMQNRNACLQLWWFGDWENDCGSSPQYSGRLNVEMMRFEPYEFKFGQPTTCVEFSQERQQHLFDPVKRMREALRFRVLQLASKKLLLNPQFPLFAYFDATKQFESHSFIRLLQPIGPFAWKLNVATNNTWDSDDYGYRRTYYSTTSTMVFLFWHWSPDVYLTSASAPGSDPELEDVYRNLSQQSFQYSHQPSAQQWIHRLQAATQANTVSSLQPCLENDPVLRTGVTGWIARYLTTRIPRVDQTLTHDSSPFVECEIQVVLTRPKHEWLQCELSLDAYTERFHDWQLHFNSYLKRIGFPKQILEWTVVSDNSGQVIITIKPDEPVQLGAMQVLARNLKTIYPPPVGQIKFVTTI